MLNCLGHSVSQIRLLGFIQLKTEVRSYNEISDKAAHFWLLEIFGNIEVMFVHESLQACRCFFGPIHVSLPDISKHQKVWNMINSHYLTIPWWNIAKRHSPFWSLKIVYVGELFDVRTVDPWGSLLSGYNICRLWVRLPHSNRTHRYFPIRAFRSSQQSTGGFWSVGSHMYRTSFSHPLLYLTISFELVFVDAICIATK